MFLFLSFFCFWLSLSLIKELFLLGFISFKLQKGLEILLIFYFLGIFLFFPSSYFLIFICFLLIATLFLLKHEKEKQLFNELCELLIPLESAMKSGMSFLNGWDKAVKESNSKAHFHKLKEFSKVLTFQNRFVYPDNKKVEKFILELLSIKQSPQPLKRIHYLKRKLKVEMVFKIKANRALLQIKAQSFILCLFYIGILINTLIVYQKANFKLILISLLLFIIGLVWIFNSGRNIKWSI